jgi:hypothetical protein
LSSIALRSSLTIEWRFTNLRTTAKHDRLAEPNSNGRGNRPRGVGSSAGTG